MMMRACVVGLVIALTVGGCSHKQDSPQSATIDVSNDELQNQKFITRDVTLAVGGTLKVTLASNGSTGFTWTSDAQIADPAVVKQTAHESTPPTSPLLGAPGTEAWSFEALKVGTTTIAMDYSQPWAGGTKGAWTFKANVKVQ